MISDFLCDKRRNKYQATTSNKSVLEEVYREVKECTLPKKGDLELDLIIYSRWFEDCLTLTDTINVAFTKLT